VDPDQDQPVVALRALLQAYDRANRLAIDTVYAQLSPTLDDYYDEDLRLVFPEGSDAQGSTRPEIVLTRTVPGQEPKSVRGPGAPFPLARAATLVGAALVRGSRSGPDGWDGRHGPCLRPRQVGRSQAVALYLEPEGIDVTALLSSLGRVGPSQEDRESDR
jgi:hypothetical protein